MKGKREKRERERERKKKKVKVEGESWDSNPVHKSREKLHFVCIFSFSHSISCPSIDGVILKRVSEIKCPSKWRSRKKTITSS